MGEILDKENDIFQKKMVEQLSKELHIHKNNVTKTLSLLDEGNTVPFIARYRKEATGSLDEEQIRSIFERSQYLRGLEQRKQEVLRLIGEQGKLSDELHQQIIAAQKLQEVEDYYRPYKLKRRTKATIAKERGLEPLAEWLLLQKEDDPTQEASKYISEENEITTAEDALQGAMDIIAEKVSDDAQTRQWIRQVTYKKGHIESKQKQQEENDRNVYEMYYEYKEALVKLVPHRILAMNRGEKEGILQVGIISPVEDVYTYLKKNWISKETNSGNYVKKAIEDSYKRLIAPAIEREIRKELTEKAEEQAIQVFSKNLRSLLLQPPVRGKVVLGLDPAYRTGCKVAVVDPTGKVLKIDVIYPTPPNMKLDEAIAKIHTYLDEFGAEIIAIGNGTASRETEQFVADIIRQREDEIAYIIVNEAGASVYSASPLAKEEFPNLDVSERSAISIARRLQDPLAELVKIDPKSVGVGQYQHDVTQSRLNESLTFVVETVVNQVGVDVNTASSSLLQYISGLNKSVALQIVKRREEEGIFTRRSELKKVPRLGAKTYEQAIGFLRIFGGEDAFDQTPIHPETYDEAKRFLEELGYTKEDLGSSKLADALNEIDVQKWAHKLEIGVPTLQDIIAALKSPRRDPRDQLPKPLLLKDVLKLEDLSQGMKLEGTVRNVVDFGAFVDIGLKNDGLVHISQLSNKFVANPMEIVQVGDIVTVWVLDIDQKRGRVGLSMLPQ